MLIYANPAEQFKSYQSEIEDAILSVIRGNSYILGKEVSAFEKEFASYIGTNSAIGVANGTNAIEIALRALDIGIGDEVITVSHTAVATVTAIEATGASAVLVDVEPDFYTLDPAQLNEVITNKTKAVIVVHLYGQPADMDNILSFCNKNKLFLLEDASQAHGAKYKGFKLGTLGVIGCFSCYPTKNLGALGDAGVVTTNSPVLSLKISKLREYGWNNGVSEYPGMNSRLDEIQAAVLRVKLKYLDSDNTKRRKLADLYTQGLSDLPIQVPIVREGSKSVFHLYVIQVENRQGLLSQLKEKGILAGIHYPTPVHLQPAYKGRIKTATDMSVTEAASKKIVSLPLYPELSRKNAEKIISALRDYLVKS